MGEKTIASQVKIDGDIAPDFTYDWEIAYKGEKYIMPLRKPQGSKENTSLNAVIDLTFQHWAVYQLKRWWFATMADVDTNTAVADKYEASVSLNLRDFCNLFAKVLKHYYGETIAIDLNPNLNNSEVVNVSISHSYIWDVLTKLHELYGVRWEIVASENNSHLHGAERYVIRVGYETNEVSHIFEYGFEGGLMKVERQVQSEDIRNMLMGRGGSENLPKYYFKQVPESEKERYHQDPDWMPELANIYFDKLRGATFRSYVQGWKFAKHGGEDKRNTTYAQWAYDKGVSDNIFNPIEYVKDDESIASYGELFGGLSDNDEIYPSLTFSGKNAAVAVQQITSDDLQGTSKNDAQVITIANASATAVGVETAHTKKVTINGGTFTIPEGMVGNFYDDTQLLRVINTKTEELLATRSSSNHIAEFAEVVANSVKVRLLDNNGLTVSAVGIPSGIYQYFIDVEVYNLYTEPINIEVGTVTPKVMYSTPQPKWENTFDVWVENLWDSEIGERENEEAYAKRVWTRILGDREGGEAKVMFTTGALAVSEDYEFAITRTPAYDTSKTYTDANGKTINSHWRLTLAKSDADFESAGVYVPSTMRQGSAGDKFVFLGIEPTQEYVEWAERALDDSKTDELNKIKDVKPTWAVTMDRVRLNNEGKAGALIDELKVGASLRLADKRFITIKNEQGQIVQSSPETLYLQSLTLTYREPTSEDTALNPDVEVVLSNDYSVSANPVSTIQSDIDVIRQQIGAISNVEKIVRVVGDKLYLRKDGLKDRSYSPTEFASLVSSDDFRSGIIGGEGWGIFKDANNNWVLETDKINVRQEMQVTTLVVNNAQARGGMEISSAAVIECTDVVRGIDGEYTCYFDQKGGSVVNMFKVGDIAYSQRWKADNSEMKYYKRKVTAVGANYITLASVMSTPVGATPLVDGSGVPEAGDVIIHFGNYTDKTRQYVKVRDVINGGYERYLEGLNSVQATGTEYYFVGMLHGSYADKPRFFIGNDTSFIEFLNGKVTIKAELSVESTVDGQALPEYINQSVSDNAELKYLSTAMSNSTTITGGLVLTSAVEVGAKDSQGQFVTMAGMSGLVDSEHTNGGVVFWGGGTYEQAKNGASTYVIYADGTGHAAKGTIKFLENQLQVGQYVNLTNEGLDMTINGQRKMQMGNYETQPEFVMNHKKVIALLNADGDPLVSTSSLPLWRIASGTSYSAYVEGLGDPTNHKNFEVSIGSGIKGATLKFNLIININTSIPSSFTSLNTSGLPTVSAWVIDTKTGASYTLGTAKLSRDSEGRLVYSYSEVEQVLSRNHNELKLRVEIWNKIVLTDENKASGAWLQTETVNVNSGEFDTVEQFVPEYNQTTLGNNGLQVSWGNCHQYQKAGFWGVRVGELGLQVTDGNIKLLSRSMGGWVSLADYIKHIVSTMPKEGSEE